MSLMRPAGHLSVLFGALMLMSSHAARAEAPVGYAFDKPRVLTQQIIWGLAHGVRLLGEACERRGDTAAANAYADWRTQQQASIAAAERDLARHYFQRDTALAAELDVALKLPAALKLTEAELQPACATLGEALKKPRYDLAHYYAARRDAIMKGDPMFPGARWDSTDEPAIPAVPPVAAPAAEAPLAEPAEPPAVAAPRDEAAENRTTTEPKLP